MVLLMVVAAAAVLAMLVMVMLLMVVAAAAVLAMLVMMVLLMVVAMTTAAAMMFLLGMCQSFHMGGQAIQTSHSLQNLLAIQLIPGGGDQRSRSIVLANQCHGIVQLVLRNAIGTGQNNGAGSFDLVVVELTKVLHIHLHLAGIGHGHGVAQNYILADHLLHSGHNITELAHTGGLDHDAVRVILLDHLGQGLAEIAHQAAANTAGVHFRNIHTGILQETTVNTDLAELIFDKNQLLTLVSFLDHLLDQRGFASAQKTGIDINLSHRKTFFLAFFAIIPPKHNGCKENFQEKHLYSGKGYYILKVE